MPPLRHMPGAFVIAMSNYGTQEFNMLADVTMQPLLYDVWKEEHVLKARRERFADPGIRVFLPERDRSISVSCHSHDDLCLRMVQHLMLHE